MGEALKVIATKLLRVRANRKQEVASVAAASLCGRCNKSQQFESGSVSKF